MAEMLRSAKVIAVVGCSRDETKYSYIVARFLKSVGYRIIPINPVADEILGEKVYKSLDEVPEKVDIVDVFRPGEEALGIAVQAVRHKAKVLWLQEGIISSDAQKYAQENHMEFVQDMCTMKEYQRMMV